MNLDNLNLLELSAQEVKEIDGGIIDTHPIETVKQWIMDGYVWYYNNFLT